MRKLLKCLPLALMLFAGQAAADIVWIQDLAMFAERSSIRARFDFSKLESGYGRIIIEAGGLRAGESNRQWLVKQVENPSDVTDHTNRFLEAINNPQIRSIFVLELLVSSGWETPTPLEDIDPNGQFNNVETMATSPRN